MSCIIRLDFSNRQPVLFSRGIVWVRLARSGKDWHVSRVDWSVTRSLTGRFLNGSRHACYLVLVDCVRSDFESLTNHLYLE
jgi:hypothetical protein